MEKGEGGGDLNFPPKTDQSEAADSATPADFPAAKKLARQLDFNTVPGGAPVVLPEHPHRPAVVQMQQEKPSLQQQPPPPQLMPAMQHPHGPTTHQQQPLRPVKLESPKARPRQNVEVKDGTPKKQKQCNCKHSRCLKLYCECFASGIYCDGCNCVNCHNNVDNEPARREAVEATLERNPNAFRPKIASSPHSKRDNKEEAGEVVVLAKHNKGCHCKKSGCLKKYCECFQANILCSENCKCIDCKNFEGSEERQALFHGDPANNITYLQLAANAAITGAIGSSGFGSPPVSKKRKAHELFFGGGPVSKDPSFHRLSQFQQTNHVKTCVPSSPLSSVAGARVANNAPVGPSKYTYRSLLADLIRPDDMKELCSVLVVYASEAARMLADDKNAKDKTTENNEESSSGVQTDKTGPDGSGSDVAEPSKGGPMSPGTLALMCDEQDTGFTGSNGPLDHGAGAGADGPVMTETYVEQEKIVLTAFRDCLNKLITLGELKETQCSSLAKSEGQSQTQAIEGACWQTFNNGFPGPVVVPKSQNTSNNNNTRMKIPFHVGNGDLKLEPEKDV